MIAVVFASGFATGWTALPPAALGVSPNSWVGTADIPALTTRQQVVTLLDGRIMFIGADAVPNVATPLTIPTTPQIYDPVSGSWSPTSTPPWGSEQVQGQFAVRLTDGRVLVGGGSAPAPSVHTTRDVAIYDPAQPNGGTWSATTLLPVGLTSAGAALMADGRVFVANGEYTLAFTVSGESWQTLQLLPGNAVHQAVVLSLPDNRVILMGGWYDSSHAATSFWVYTPGTDSWTIGPVTVGGDGSAGVVLPSGKVLLVNGGTDSTIAANISILFDPATFTYKLLPAMQHAHSGEALLLMPNGYVLAAGGRSAPGPAIKDAEIFDPASNNWYAVASLADYHDAPGGAVLPNGSVLIAGGNTLTSEIYEPGDITAPAIGAPVATFRTGVSMGSTLPVRLTWFGADGGGSGFSMDLERSVNGGSYTRIVTGTHSNTRDVSLAPGKTYRYRVRGRDGAGHTTSWHTGPTLRPKRVQQTSMTFTPSWKTKSSSSFSGGSAKYTTSAGGSGTYSFTGRAIGLVSLRASGRGAAKIYLDGTYVTTVDLGAASSTYTYVAFSKVWPSSSSHKIKIVNVGTIGRPRIEVDAFEVM
jgi:hypothetical protein